MTVETANYISQLDPSLPGQTDYKVEGDNHIRLVKTAVQQSFPAINAPVTSSPDDLNMLSGAATGTEVVGLNVETQAASNASTLAASTEHVANAILAASGITANLPGQGGNSGKVLKTNGSSAYWGYENVPFVTAVNAEITYPASPGTAAYVQYPIALDADRDLVLLVGDTQSLFGTIYTRSTGLFGTVTAIRTTSSTSMDGRVRAVLVSTDKVLVVSCNATTGFQAVVLTITGTTISPGSAATKTLGNNVTTFDDFITVGSTYVLGYTSSGPKALGITVSGTTPSIGSTERALSANTGNYGVVTLYPIDTTRLLAFCASATANGIDAMPVTCSGNALSTGTKATLSGTDAYLYYQTCVITTGRWAILYTNTNQYVSVVSVSSTTASASTVEVSSSTSNYGSALIPLSSGTCLSVCIGSGAYCNVVTDGSGTATAGTEIKVAFGDGFVGYDSTGIFVTRGGVDGGQIIKVGRSGANPTILSIRGDGVSSEFGTYESYSGVKDAWRGYSTVLSANTYIAPLDKSFGPTYCYTSDGAVTMGDVRTRVTATPVGSISQARGYAAVDEYVDSLKQSICYWEMA